MACHRWFLWHIQSLDALAHESHNSKEAALALVLMLSRDLALVLAVSCLQKRWMVVVAMWHLSEDVSRRLTLPLPLSLPLTLSLSLSLLQPLCTLPSVPHIFQRFSVPAPPSTSSLYASLRPSCFPVAFDPFILALS